MRAILINPKTREITEIDPAPGCKFITDYEQLQPFVDYKLFQPVNISTKHEVLVNDEGLIDRKDVYMFSIKGHHELLAGMAIVTNFNANRGVETACDLSIEQVRAMVQWHGGHTSKMY
jgi:hypothetical protein